MPRLLLDYFWLLNGLRAHRAWPKLIGAVPSAATFAEGGIDEPIKRLRLAACRLTEEGLKLAQA